MSETGAGRAPAAIVVDSVSHTYPGGTVALDGVDLTIGRGLFGLLGPNGAGKSTLMRIICTLLAPTAGRVTVGGHDVVRDRAAIRERLGYLPQEFGAWRLHRVEEVLDAVARLSGVRPRSRRRERVQAVLEAVGLTEVARRKVKKLSGGMLRRLGVAQSLIHEPEFLVVDEPTVGLDPEERIRFRELMAAMARERTIVLSTHIVGDIGAGCRDIALLDAGALVFRGSPEQLVAKARGRVFELLVDAAHADVLPDGVEEVSRSADGAKVRIRAVSALAQLPAGARPLEQISLEEAYLAFMAARGRADALQAEGAA
ncbi:MAG: ATP-binding cassette domain-containing protein [Acidobacteriota bacterium]|nr:ATP-binding cassette domain-containing protein [Acidobacteriota bacterium]